MRALSTEVNDKDEIILTCESSIFFGLYKWQTQYIATEERPIGYWNWRKLPNKTLVGDIFCFQLDSWHKDLK